MEFRVVSVNADGMQLEETRSQSAGLYWRTLLDLATAECNGSLDAERFGQTERHEVLMASPSEELSDIYSAPSFLERRYLVTQQTDPMVLELRKRYKKKGPNPGKDLNKWAENFADGISRDVRTAERLIRQKVPIEEICEQTGLRKETIMSLYSSKKRKGGNEK